MHESEQDLRLHILNTLLTTPHRNLQEIWPVHAELVKQDPLFYARLGAWYSDKGDVRDHKEMFVVTLVLSDFEGHRDVGLALLRGLPPYQVVRVLDFIHGRKTTRKVRVRREGAPAEVQQIVEEFGLFRNPPRSLRTEITRYLREREADADWFDSTVLVARKALKRLYAVLHVAPGERAQQVLFDERPPADSRLFALRELAKAATPEEQARAISEQRIPYRVAATVVRQMTPPVLAALVERMSPQELINNVASLKRRGAFDYPEVKELIERKLGEAKVAPRVSAFKAEEALKSADVPAEVRQQLEAVASAQVAARGRIERPTALLIDKSSSMSAAIELGKRIGAMLSAICARELYVYAFDTAAHPVAPAGKDLAAWQRALVGVTAGGATSCGVAVEALRQERRYVEQIIVVSDEYENTAPLFVDAVKKYREEVRSDPSLCFVKVPGATEQLERACRAAGLAADAFQFEGDYYALPNLIPLLTRPSKLDLLMEIMEYPLPQRRAS
jgi:hypothetical protein